MKCFIIRLKENEHSCSVAADCYNQAKKFGIEPEYFDAINGQNADEHYESTGIKKAKKFKKNRPGVMGCFFSHYYLWLKCIELNEPLIILEHDGYMIKEIPENILEYFSDVLKLDNHDPFSKTYNKDISSDKDVLEVIKYYNTKSKPTAKDTKTKKFPGTGNYFRGAYSYVLKPQGAQKIINYIKQHGHLPADQQIGDKVVDTRVTTSTFARLHPFYAIGLNIKQSSLTRNLKE